MSRVLKLATLAIAVALPAWQALAQVPTVDPIAEVGPWPVASQFVGHRGRVWFVNSVKGVNHNAADLYSLSQADLVPRFERSLFSQDAGDPVAAWGNLYWPLEDSRNSVGWAEMTVTDGETWRRVAIPTAQSFHNHAMIAWRDSLIAATSAWRAGLQISADAGSSWRQLYDHPTPEGRVSRIVKLAAAESFFLSHLIDVGRHRILRSNAAGTTVLDGWPEDLRVVALAGWNDAVYLAANPDDGIGLWRSDGKAPQRLAAQLPDGRVQDLHAAGGRLWLLTAEGGGGSVWSSNDGLAWQRELRLRGGTPWDLYIEGSSLYIGGTADSGLAAVWAQTQGTVPQRRKVSTRGSLAAVRQATHDWTQAAAGLDRLLAEPESYRSRSILRDEVYRLAMAGPPQGFFAERLLRQGQPAGALGLIGGRVQVPNRDFADWLLFWGMGMTGQKGVPTEFLRRPWVSPPNGAEKYFEPAPAALWAIVMGGQADRDTVEVLIERLGFEGDPDWLRNQVAGTLATLTGQPKDLNRDAWLVWWASAKSNWPS